MTTEYGIQRGNIHSTPPIEEVLAYKSRIKILKALSIYREAEFDQIVKGTGISPQLVEKHIKYFFGLGFVEKIQSEQDVCYRINTDNRNASLLQDLLDFWILGEQSSQCL